MTATGRRRLVSDKTQQILDALAAMGENKLTFVERVHQLGFAEGYAQGMTKRFAMSYDQAFAEGYALVMAKGVLMRLGWMHLATSQDQRQRIMACIDVAQLNVWLYRADNISSVDEIFVD